MQKRSPKQLSNQLLRFCSTLRASRRREHPVGLSGAVLSFTDRVLNCMLDRTVRALRDRLNLGAFE